MSRIVHTIAAIVAAAIVAGCGVPTGPDSFEEIPDAEVPNRLAETTTTTSTTTTTTTTLPDSPATTVATTTTVVPTQIVEVFFLSRSELRPIELPAQSPVVDTELILLLEQGPVGPSAALLDNQIEEGLIIDTEAEGGILTIDLDEEIFDDISRQDDQREAIGQIVLTFLNGLSAVGNAVFTFNGSDQNVSVPTGNALFTNRPVSVDDYASMRIDAEPAEPEPEAADTTTTGPPTETDGPEATIAE